MHLPLLLSGILLLPGGPTGTASPAAPPTATAGEGAPVASVDGQPLTRGDYKEFLLQNLQGSLLDAFINEKILSNIAKKEGIAITEKDAEEWIERQIQTIQSMPDYEGTDLDEFRKRYKAQARTGCLIERLVKRRRTDEAGLKREYEMRYGEKRRTRHILLRGAEAPENPFEKPKALTPEDFEAAKKKADELHEMLKKGADFAKLAEKESADPGSARSGGEIPELTRVDALVPEYIETAFALKEGEISAPVKSEYGWHLIQVTKIVPPAKPLDEKLMAELRDEAMKRPVDREELQRFLEEIREGVKVEKFLE